MGSTSKALAAAAVLLVALALAPAPAGALWVEEDVITETPFWISATSLMWPRVAVSDKFIAFFSKFATGTVTRGTGTVQVLFPDSKGRFGGQKVRPLMAPLSPYGQFGLEAYAYDDELMVLDSTASNRATAHVARVTSSQPYGAPTMRWVSVDLASLVPTAPLAGSVFTTTAWLGDGVLALAARTGAVADVHIFERDTAGAYQFSATVTIDTGCTADHTVHAAAGLVTLSTSFTNLTSTIQSTTSISSTCGFAFFIRKAVDGSWAQDVGATLQGGNTVSGWGRHAQVSRDNTLLTVSRKERAWSLYFYEWDSATGTWTPRPSWSPPVVSTSSGSDTGLNFEAIHTTADGSFVFTRGMVNAASYSSGGGNSVQIYADHGAPVGAAGRWLPVYRSDGDSSNCIVDPSVSSGGLTSRIGFTGAISHTGNAAAFLLCIPTVTGASARHLKWRVLYQDLF